MVAVGGYVDQSGTKKKLSDIAVVFKIVSKQQMRMFYDLATVP
jgi:hypothetical protein